MTFKAIQTLAEILILIDDFPWNRAVYVTGEYPWEANSVAAVLDPTEIEDLEEEEKPEIIRQYDLRYVLNINIVQSVVHVARKQVPEPDMGFLIESFNYYCKNDAFLWLNK